MNNLMTISQSNYIEYLLKIKKVSDQKLIEWEVGNVSIYSTDKKYASDLIQFLLTCENKTSEEIELDNIKRNIYRIIEHKRTKKGAKMLSEINTILGKNLWYKGQEESLTAEELLKVKDFVY